MIRAITLLVFIFFTSLTVAHAEPTTHERYHDQSKRHFESGFYGSYLSRDAARDIVENKQEQETVSPNIDDEGISRSESELGSKSYGYLSHSELNDIMFSQRNPYDAKYPSKRTRDYATGFLLLEARYSGSACLSVEILETVFFEPSPYFLKRAERKLKRACDNALPNLARDITEVHYLTIPLMGLLTHEDAVRTCGNSVRLLSWAKEFCGALLHHSEQIFDSTTAVTFEEVQKFPPFSEDARYAFYISNLLFYFSNKSQQVRGDAVTLDLLWQALWYSLLSGEARLYLKLFPEEMTKQLTVAGELAKKFNDYRLANSLVMIGTRLNRNSTATALGSEAVADIEAQVASLAPYEVVVQLPQNYPLLNSRSYASIPLNKRKIEVKSEVRGIEQIQVSCGYGHYADLSQIKLEIGKKLKFPDRRDCRLEFFGSPNSAVHLRFFD